MCQGCASVLSGARAFVTNDLRLRQVEKPDIIVLADWEQANA